jgi:hypothetical protein
VKDKDMKSNDYPLKELGRQYVKNGISVNVVQLKAPIE